MAPAAKHLLVLCCLLAASVQPVVAQVVKIHHSGHNGVGFYISPIHIVTALHVFPQHCRSAESMRRNSDCLSLEIDANADVGPQFIAAQNVFFNQGSDVAIIALATDSSQRSNNYLRLCQFDNTGMETAAQTRALHARVDARGTNIPIAIFNGLNQGLYDLGQFSTGGIDDRGLSPSDSGAPILVHKNGADWVSALYKGCAGPNSQSCFSFRKIAYPAAKIADVLRHNIPGAFRPERIDTQQTCYAYLPAKKIAVEKLQRSLRARNCAPGKIDGDWGKNTWGALVRMRDALQASGISTESLGRSIQNLDFVAVNRFLEDLSGTQRCRKIATVYGMFLKDDAPPDLHSYLGKDHITGVRAKISYDEMMLEHETTALSSIEDTGLGSIDGYRIAHTIVEGHEQVPRIKMDMMVSLSDIGDKEIAPTTSQVSIRLHPHTRGEEKVRKNIHLYSRRFVSNCLYDLADSRIGNVRKNVCQSVVRRYKSNLPEQCPITLLEEAISLGAHQRAFKRLLAFHHNANKRAQCEDTRNWQTLFQDIGLLDAQAEIVPDFMSKIFGQDHLQMYFQTSEYVYKSDAALSEKLLKQCTELTKCANTLARKHGVNLDTNEDQSLLGMLGANGLSALFHGWLSDHNYTTISSQQGNAAFIQSLAKKDKTMLASILDMLLTNHGPNLHKDTQQKAFDLGMALMHTIL